MRASLNKEHYEQSVQPARSFHRTKIFRQSGSVTTDYVAGFCILTVNKPYASIREQSSDHLKKRSDT